MRAPNQEILLKVQVIDVGINGLIHEYIPRSSTPNDMAMDAFDTKLLILMHCKLDLLHQMHLNSMQTGSTSPNALECMAK